MKSTKLVSAGSAEPTLREDIEPPPAVSEIIIHRHLSKADRKKLQAKYTHPDHVAFFKEQEQSGEYDIDLKIDRTEIIRQQKQQETENLKERNNVLEAWARQQEAKVKEQEVKQKKMEKDMEKMASLISQLMGK